MRIERLSTGRLAALLFLCAVLLYGRSVTFDFVYDDEEYVRTNPLLAGGWTWANARAAFGTFHSGNWHPLTWLSHMLDVELFGLEPAGHHAVNVLLHGLDAVLVLLVMLALIRDRTVALVLAALFVVHPLRVESVAWVSERKDLLASAFSLLAILAWVRYARERSPAAYLLALGAFVLGALSKPMVVTLPCVLLVLDAWPLGRLAPRAWPRLLLEKVPFLAGSVALSLLAMESQAAAGAVAAELPFGLRLLNALAGCEFYLEKALWPVGLSVHYPHAGLHVADPVAALRARALIGAALVVLGLVLGLRNARRQPALLAGLLLFLGSLVPVLGLVQVGSQSWADRYAYLPLLWLSLAVVVPLAELARRRSWSPGLLRGCVLGLCLALALRTLDQTSAWRDDESLFRQALANAGPSPIVLTNLGNALLERGELEEAERHLRASLALEETWVAHQNLGMALDRRGDRGGALEHTARAVELGDARPTTALYLASLQVALGQPERAETTLRGVLERFPGEPSALFNLGVLAARREDLATAERCYLELVARDPTALDARVNLADVYLRTDRPAEALPHLSLAVESARDDPAIGANPRVLQALADACFRTGARGDAVRWQSRAVELLAKRPALQERARALLERYRAGG